MVVASPSRNFPKESYYDWIAEDDLSIQKIPFPAPNGSTEADSYVQTLKSDCQPATFGVSGRDFLDVSYQKASKLDSTRFSTNFHPADYEILDSIAQILLSGILIERGERIGIVEGRIRAELYKLNVCPVLAGISIY